MSSNSCCTTGFRWNETPKGSEIDVCTGKSYVTGGDQDVAVVIFHDAFGWTLSNPRLLADHFAKEVGATAYVPDFLHGTEMPKDSLTMKRDGDDFKVDSAEDLDIDAFLSANTFEKRKPEILDFLRELRTKHSKIGAVGYCWGGATLVKLASKAHNNIIDCVTVAHPASFEKADVEAISVPIQILAPEKDFTFTQELKDYCQTIIPTLGVQYDYQHFPRVTHGFACRGDIDDEIGRWSLERAKSATVYWFRTFLK